MFKKGEKIVCINNGDLFLSNNSFNLPRHNKLKLYEIYTVDKVNPDDFGIEPSIYLKEFEDYMDFFNCRRFVSLKKYRKQKIQKINEI